MGQANYYLLRDSTNHQPHSDRVWAGVQPQDRQSSEIHHQQRRFTVHSPQVKELSLLLIFNNQLKAIINKSHE